MKTEYKHEHFVNPDFPVYSSTQEGREELVIIHYHSAVEVMRVMKGLVRVLYGDSYIECGAGDIIFVPPSVIHGVTALNETATIRGITFEPSVLGPMHEQRSNAELLQDRSLIPHVLSAGEEGHEELISALRRADAAYGDFSMTGELKMRSALLQMTAVAMEIFDIGTEEQDRSSTRLGLVLDFIEGHYSEKLRVRDLAEMIHVCDDRLIRLFREVTGKTPVEYIMSLRIESALKLLSTTDMSVAEIAERTGFGCDTYLTRTFRTRLNMTPGQYRRK